MKAMGVDLGRRRIGIAMSDSAGSMAMPREVLERSGDPARDRRALADMAIEEGVDVVVVGLPVELDGRQGPAARAAAQEIELLRGILCGSGVEVTAFDERLTTVTASRRLHEAGRSTRRQRTTIDKAAATVLLQDWLDRSRGASPPSGGAG